MCTCAGRRVARLPGVDHQHRAPRPGQGQRPAQPGGAAADHHHVVRLVHACLPRLSSAPTVRHAANRQVSLPVWQTTRTATSWRPSAPGCAPCGSERGTTLTQLAETTGISVSTLSRLESGGRRPTLELLLPLAKAHQVPLDELVDAPATGDPRVHPRPIVRATA